MNDEQLDTIIQYAQNNERQLVVKELVRIYTAGIVHGIDEVIDTIPKDEPTVSFPHPIPIEDVIRIGQTINQEGYSEGFISASDSMRYICEYLLMEYGENNLH